MSKRLKKKIIRNDFEESVREGSIFDKEINLVQRLNHPNKNCVFPLHQKKIKLFEYEFLKTYLYALHTDVLENPDLSVDNFNALASNANPVIMAPDIVGTDDNGLAVVENQTVFVNLRYNNAAYQVTVYLQTMQHGPFNIHNFYISVLGVEPDSYKTIELAEFLIKESTKNSYYRNKILSVTCEDSERIDINLISDERFLNEDLKNLFIPDNVKSELERFYLCVENYNEIGLGFRFLLCGEPGTGKTKSIRTLINMCYKKATIILVEGEVDFKSLFEFASMFEPAIVCIDDLDLLVGSRDKAFSPNSLGALLQELDGFNKNNIFLLATTNDKELIDKAASRPGRFDMVIDYNKIDKDNYIELLHSSCKTPEILETFDDSVISVLKKNKITGAYLVNLIKQIEVKYKLDPQCDLKEYIRNLIKLTYRGFYKKTEEEKLSVGFNNYDGNGIEVIDI